MASPYWLQPIHPGDRVTVTTMSGEMLIGILTEPRQTRLSKNDATSSPVAIVLDENTIVPWHAVATITKHRTQPYD